MGPAAILRMARNPSMSVSDPREPNLNSTCNMCRTRLSSVGGHGSGLSVNQEVTGARGVG